MCQRWCCKPVSGLVNEDEAFWYIFWIGPCQSTTIWEIVPTKQNICFPVIQVRHLGTHEAWCKHYIYIYIRYTQQWSYVVHDYIWCHGWLFVHAQLRPMVWPNVLSENRKTLNPIVHHHLSVYLSKLPQFDKIPSVSRHTHTSNVVWNILYFGIIPLYDDNIRVSLNTHDVNGHFGNLNWRYLLHTMRPM